MEIDLGLLDNSGASLLPSRIFEAELNAHGSYHAERFVLRLSPVVRAQLNRFPGRLTITKGSDFRVAQAMSTQLHETIHWWQHIGTTAGLILSLSYPAQAHVNHGHLKRVLREYGPKKSLRKLAQQVVGKVDPDSAAGSLRIVVNNQSDLNFYRAMATNPESLRVIAEDPYFLNVGHAFHIAVSDVISVLASTFDEDCQFLPDPRNWEPLFQKLLDNKIDGFYPGSPIEISPLGVLEIGAAFLQKKAPALRRQFPSHRHQAEPKPFLPALDQDQALHVFSIRLQLLEQFRPLVPAKGVYLSSRSQP